MTSLKKILVIGAGSCGLTAIKACLEEGLSVTCYEVTNHLGGVWKYTEEDDEQEIPSMFQNVYMNSSKEMTSFSDFPPPKEFPNFMHHSLWYSYLESYAKAFRLTEHIHFRHRVIKVEAASDYDSTGKWNVEVVNLDDDGEKVKEVVFDAVVVATGQHCFPFTPTVPGLEDFQGQKMHSRSYKKPDPFKDKRVLVYGLGNSGLDVATDIAKVARKVYLSSRSGNWISARLAQNGQPVDVLNNRRYSSFLRSFLPRFLLSTIIENRLNQRMDHKLYGINPKHRFLNQIPRVSDTLPLCITYGLIEVKPNLRRLTKEGVVFTDSDQETPVDVVIFCTGFKCLFPFISTEIMDFHNRLEDVYKFVFPIRLRHHTIAFLGLNVPDQATTSIGELEARWVARVFSGNLRLPSSEAMLAESRKCMAGFRTIYGETYHHPSFVRSIPHKDTLAKIIGAKPDFGTMLLTDPRLFWKCIFGPCVPYQYRLTGPHAWEGARQAIFNVEERVNYPLLQNRKIRHESRPTPAYTFALFLFMGCCLMIFCFVFYM